MAESEKTASEKLVNSVVLTLIARFAIVVATAVVLPGALWMIQRGVGSIDEISKKIDIMRDQAFETSGAIRALQQSSATQAQILSDHEQRVRVLEAQSRRGESIAR